MIHDPGTQEVTCDRLGCKAVVEVDAGSDRAIEHELVAGYEWIVRDGQHFCSAACAATAEKKTPNA